jgi:hypothetical protein
MLFKNLKYWIMQQNNTPAKTAVAILDPLAKTASNYRYN